MNATVLISLGSLVQVNKTTIWFEQVFIQSLVIIYPWTHIYQQCFLGGDVLNKPLDLLYRTKYTCYIYKNCHRKKCIVSFPQNNRCHLKNCHSFWFFIFSFFAPPSVLFSNFLHFGPSFQIAGSAPAQNTCNLVILYK